MQGEVSSKTAQHEAAHTSGHTDLQEGEGGHELLLDGVAQHLGEAGDEQPNLLLLDTQALQALHHGHELLLHAICDNLPGGKEGVCSVWLP